MRFVFLNLLLICTLMNAWRSADAHQECSDDKSTCHDLVEDGFCRFKMFRCYMEEHCSDACGFCHDYDEELEDQHEDETPRRHKRKAPQRKGKGRHNEDLPEEVTPKRRRKNNRQRNRKQQNRSQHNKQKHQKRPKHFNSPKFPADHHHWHSHGSQPFGPHRDCDDDCYEDRSYCNDFKKMGFCEIEAFHCFMEDYCLNTCGFAPELSFFTQHPPMDITETSGSIASATEKPIEITQQPNELTEQPIEITQPPYELTEQPNKTTKKSGETTESSNEITENVITTTSQSTAAAVVISDALMEFNRELLKAHNKYRKYHSAPALVLDNDLILQAKKWADHLATTGVFQHDPNLDGVGENLAWSSANLSASQATRRWYIEIEKYNFKNPGFTPGTGHFTQVVWKSTKRLGGAFAKTSDGATYVVARYSPAGNVNTKEEFEANVLQ